MNVDSQNRKTPGWLVLGLLFMALLLFLCTCNDSRGIQSRLQSNGEAALVNAGIDGLDAEFLTVKGRDAFLEGVVPSEEVKLEAQQIIGAVQGIRKDHIVNNLQVVAPVAAEADPEPVDAETVVLRDPSLQLCISECSVLSEGLLNEAANSSLNAAIVEQCSAGQYSNAISVAEDVAAAAWLDGVISLLPSLNSSDIQDGCIIVDTGNLTLTGTAASDDLKLSLIDLANNSSALSIVDQLAVAPVELADPSFNLRLANNGAELSGTVPEATIAPAVAAASQLVGADNVINNLVPSEAVSSPEWLGRVIGEFPQFAADAQNPQLDVANQVVTLDGVVDSEDTKTEIETQFVEAAGAGISVINNIQVLEPIVEPEFNLAITDDAVNLSGTVAQETSDALTTVATDLAPTLNSDLQIANAANPDWLGSVINRIPDFGTRVTEPGIAVANNVITLEGIVESETVKTDIATDFEASVAEGVTVVNNLQVVEPVAEAVSLNVQLNDDGTVSITGDVPADVATAVTETAGEVSDSVTSNLASVPNVETPAWLSNVITRIPEFDAQVAEAEIDVADNVVTLTGVVESEEAKEAIGSDFESSVTEGVTVVNNLRVVEAEVVEPLLDPLLTITVDDSNDVILLDGFVSQETANTATETSSNIKANVTNNLQLSDDVASPEWLTNVINRAPSLATEASNAVISVEGSSVTLEGVVASEAEKTRIGAEFVGLTPAGVAVVNNLQVVEPVVEPVSLNVQLNDDGTVSITGDVPADVATAVTETAGEVSDSVTSNLASVPNVETPAWLSNVITRIPEFDAQVAEAEIDVADNVVTLTGVVESEEAKEAIGSDFESSVTESVTVVNNLRVVEAEPEVAAPEVVEAEVDTTEPEVEAEAEPVVLSDPSLNIRISDDTVSVRGQVAPGTANVVTDNTNTIATTVESGLIASANVAAPAWLTNVVDQVPNFAASTTDAELDVRGTTVTLNGLVESEEQKALIGNTFVEASGPGITVINNLRVVEPTPVPEASVAVSEAEATPTPDATVSVAEPEPAAPIVASPSLRIDCAASNVRLTGTLANEDNRQLAASVFADKTVENVIGLNAGLESPSYLSNVLGVAPTVCDDINRASLSLEDGTLTLSGVTLSNEQRDAIEAYVKDAVSPDVSVVNNLTVEPLIPFSEDGK